MPSQHTQEPVRASTEAARSCKVSRSIPAFSMSFMMTSARRLREVSSPRRALSKVVFPAPRKPESISIGRDAITGGRDLRAGIVALDIIFARKFPGPDQQFGRVAEVVKPFQCERRFDPCFGFGDLSVARIVVLAIAGAEAIDNGLFIGKEPVDERE